MGLRLFFLPNFPGAMFIQGATFIPDSRVVQSSWYQKIIGAFIHTFNVLVVYHDPPQHWPL